MEIDTTSKSKRRERRHSKEIDRILCDELLEGVLRRLPPRSTFSPSTADVSLVSRRWLRLYRSSKSNLSLSLSPDNCSPSSLSSFLSHFRIERLLLYGIRRRDHGFDWLWRSCKNLKELELSRCEGIGDDTSVSSFVNCFKGLQEVKLRGCGSIVNDVLSRLVENCTSLNSLLIHVDGSREGLLQFITHSRCNLRKLDLHLPIDLENNHLLAVAEKFRGLSSLRLDSCLNVTGEGLKTMALAMSNVLEELALINCNVEPGLLTALGHRFRNLKKLDLSFSGGMLGDEEFISMLASCKCLRDLKVRGCEGLTNTSVISMFKSCKQLESVDIVKCPGIEPEAVELFVLNCMRLRQIHVEDSKLSDVSRLWASKKFVEVVV